MQLVKTALVGGSIVWVNVDRIDKIDVHPDGSVEIHVVGDDEHDSWLSLDMELYGNANNVLSLIGTLGGVR